ncbi:MAG: phosphoglycerate kinase [Planctomycetes bacterium]|jgi:3-phosphoglycerate kinase|nr:phosphoglycerate kinase [Planctomycetota bacterium]MCP4838764.1 phosphoglycerate kinase [Planctomycetota bacterium]
MATRSVKDLKFRGKRVLVRVDFNVPLAGNEIMDDRRLAAALPTIQHILKGGGLPVLMSHLGRPAGNGPEAAFSLQPVAVRLQAMLGEQHKVHFVDGACEGAAAEAAIAGAGAGDVVLLDNLRFHAGEKKNDQALSAAIASLADVYVDDAFGTAHRDHASMVGVPDAMRDRPRVAGLLLDREIHFLARVLDDPQRPFIAILGGAKVSDKLAAIRNLLPKVDVILVGGAMAYTFMAARGDSVGDSLVEEGMMDMARELMSLAEGASTELLLPTDHRCAESIGVDVPVRTCEIGIPTGWMGLDIGPETLADWTRRILDAKTVVWNGPVGVFEQPPFDEGTVGLAHALAKSTRKHRAVTIVGGGETAAAVERAGVSSEISHISTGGGASLRMLEGAELPALGSLEAV